jgi:hypothetical protein
MGRVPKWLGDLRDPCSRPSGVVGGAAMIHTLELIAAWYGIACLVFYMLVLAAYDVALLVGRMRQ